MKRQGNIQQVKQHDKCPPNQTKEEIGSLPEKEFSIIIVKMIQNLNNVSQTFEVDEIQHSRSMSHITGHPEATGTEALS